MKYIVALDFDDTCFIDSFPDIGKPNMKVIEKAKDFKENGAEIVLWTCREGKFLKDAIEALKEYGLEVDSANKNAPCFEKRKKKEGWGEVAENKIFAHIYVDDKAPGSIEHFLKMDAEKACKSESNNK